MTNPTMKQRIWGWFFFDWASQPYNTLLLTFIFAPYFKELMGGGAEAQATWGFGVGLAGLVMALLAPVLGAIADATGDRMRWIWIFSGMYVVGSTALWWAAPGSFDPTWTMLFFAVGLIGMEFATIFTNSMLPDLGNRQTVGRISGNGWAFGYLGGLLALVFMLAFLGENATTGKTLIGIDPIFGLDASAREGTRAVGPLTAAWYAIFMIPFFLFVREPKTARAHPGAVKMALSGLVHTVRGLPKHRSLFAFLGASLLYRDALAGVFTFGGIYAAGMLEWSVVDTGTFGILAIISGALFAAIGGHADEKLGPKPVVVVSILLLLAVTVCVVFVSRDSVFGMPVEPESSLPDVVFYILGALIGAGGGALQSSSRSMMVRQADPGRMTEAFGLYALAGKATAFIAPLSIGAVTAATGSQQMGLLPLLPMFLLGLALLIWVDPDPSHE